MLATAAAAAEDAGRSARLSADASGAAANGSDGGAAGAAATANGVLLWAVRVRYYAPHVCVPDSKVNILVGVRNSMNDCFDLIWRPQVRQC